MTSEDESSQFPSPPRLVAAVAVVSWPRTPEHATSVYSSSPVSSRAPSPASSWHPPTHPETHRSCDARVLIPHTPPHSHLGHPPTHPETHDGRVLIPLTLPHGHLGIPRHTLKHMGHMTAGS